MGIDHTFLSLLRPGSGTVCAPVRTGSLCLSVYLSIYLSVCLPVCLSIYLSIYLPIYLSLTLPLPLSPYFSLPHSLPLYPSLDIQILFFFLLNLFPYLSLDTAETFCSLWHKAFASSFIVLIISDLRAVIVSPASKW